jgi:hypothetical protein
MYGIPRYAKNRPVYRCAPHPYGCALISVAVARADETVVGAVLSRLSGAHSLQSNAATPLDAAVGDSAADLLVLARDYYVEHRISGDEFRHTRAALLIQSEAESRQTDPERCRLPAGLTATEVASTWTDLELQTIERYSAARWRKLSWVGAQSRRSSGQTASRFGLGRP